MVYKICVISDEKLKYIVNITAIQNIYIYYDIIVCFIIYNLLYTHVFKKYLPPKQIYPIKTSYHIKQNTGLLHIYYFSYLLDDDF